MINVATIIILPLTVAALLVVAQLHPKTADGLNTTTNASRTTTTKIIANFSDPARFPRIDEKPPRFIYITENDTTTTTTTSSTSTTTTEAPKQKNLTQANISERQSDALGAPPTYGAIHVTARSVQATLPPPPPPQSASFPLVRRLPKLQWGASSRQTMPIFPSSLQTMTKLKEPMMMMRTTPMTMRDFVPPSSSRGQFSDNMTTVANHIHFADAPPNSRSVSYLDAPPPPPPLSLGEYGPQQQQQQSLPANYLNYYSPGISTSAVSEVPYGGSPQQPYFQSPPPQYAAPVTSGYGYASPPPPPPPLFCGCRNCLLDYNYLNQYNSPLARQELNAAAQLEQHLLARASSFLGGGAGAGGGVSPDERSSYCPPYAQPCCQQHPQYALPPPVQYAPPPPAVYGVPEPVPYPQAVPVPIATQVVFPPPPPPIFVQQPPIILAPPPTPIAAVAVPVPLLPPPPYTVATEGCGLKGANPLARTLDIEAVDPKFSDAEFGEFPWMAAILRADGSYVCSGALVKPRAVLTAAHCVSKLKFENIIVRLGEYDASSVQELPYQDVLVNSVVIHGGYHSGSLANDIAVLILAEPARLSSYIRPVCLPPFHDYVTLKCTVTGWGKNQPNGAFSRILKKVDVPIVAPGFCENSFRHSPELGPNFLLHPSDMCAGAPGKDSCYGDGGAPLVCELDGFFRLVGIVSWGIGCGEYPGVYVDVTKFVPWIYDVFAKVAF